jgi:hypothetical protein
VEPLSLSMTSLPPIALPEAAVLAVFDVPPKAASGRQTAASRMTHLKRFIDILPQGSTIAGWLLASLRDRHVFASR